jgi:hypothetical protein
MGGGRVTAGSQKRGPAFCAIPQAVKRDYLVTQ